VQQFDWHVPDVIVIPGGNLGNVSALGSGLSMMKELALIDRLPRIVVAQAQRANPLYRAYLKNFEVVEPMQAETTLASAIQIGNPVSMAKAIRTLRQFDGMVLDATEEELADAAALGDRTGMYNDPHTGVALAVLVKLVEAKKINRSDRVVVISTANGLKFTDFKVGYHEGTLGFHGAHRNQPVSDAFRATCRLGSAPESDANLAALLEARTAVCTVERKTSRLHVEEVLRTSLEENLRVITGSVGYLRENGRRVIYDAEHFF